MSILCFGIAPIFSEILLGSTRYTKGVDMWSVGCILGELLGGQPMFPGESTMNQLEKIIELTGKPSKEDVKAIKSKHTQTMLESLNVKPKKSLTALFPTASAEAVDLLNKLLQFNPDKRIDAETALRHPYLSQFHNPADEPLLSKPITISIDDNKRFSIAEYRKYLYRKIVQRKKQLREKRAKAMESAAPTQGGQQSSTQSKDDYASDNDYSPQQSPQTQSTLSNSSHNTQSSAKLHNSSSQSNYSAAQSHSSASQQRVNQSSAHSSTASTAQRNKATTATAAASNAQRNNQYSSQPPYATATSSSLAASASKKKLGK
jgi:mitogen-activated protein kinase 15